MKKYLFLRDNSDNTTAFYHEDHVWDHFLDPAEFTYICSVKAEMSTDPRENPGENSDAFPPEAPIKVPRVYETGFGDHIVVREIYYDPADAEAPPKPVRDPMIVVRIENHVDGRYILIVAALLEKYKDDVIKAMAPHDKLLVKEKCQDSNEMVFMTRGFSVIISAMNTIMSLIRDIKNPDSSYYNK